MHLSDLEARYDGRIPRDMRRKARNLPAPRVSACVPPRAQRTATQTVVAMAEILADAYRRNGCATEADLRAAGFRGRDIKTHGKAAADAAQAEGGLT